MDVNPTSEQGQTCAVAKPIWPRDISEMLRAYRAADPITPALASFISHEAWRLDRLGGGSERSSHQWRLTFAAMRAADKWNPGRAGYETWVVGGIRLEALKIAEELARRNRRWQKTVWIDAAADDEDASSATIDLVSVNGVWRMVSAIDMRACYERLNSLERTIFRRIIAGYSRREIANAMRFRPSTFYGRIWPHFANNVRRFYER